MSWNHFEGGAPAIPTGPSVAVGIVQQIMGSLSTQVASFTAAANRTMAALQNVSIDSVGEMPTLALTRDTTALSWASPSPLDVSGMGSISAGSPSDGGIGSFNPGVTITPPTFSSSVSSINIPPSPASVDTSGLPTHPVIDASVILPTLPNLAVPAIESLDAIVIPAFSFPALPVFTDTAPTFGAAAPNVLVNWVEPVYASTNFDTVKATIARMFQGGTGLPPVIEQQLFDRARGREDTVAAKAVAEAFDTFASKGFVAPPGMLVAQVNAARETGQLQVNSLQRDITLKIADVAIENMKFAVQQGLAAENIIYNIFNNAAQRAYEIAKFTVESQLQLYGVQVSIFNAQTASYQTRAQVFKIQLDGKLAALEAYRIQLEGQKVISEVNAQKVQTFNARVQALLSQVEIYKAQMQGAQIKTEVARTQIEIFKTDVQAYAERIGADKVRFDAYRIQVEAETAKVGIIDAEARVFATLMSAEEIKANVGIKNIQLQIEQTQAATARFAASIDLAKVNVQAQGAAVEAKARAVGLSIQNLSAQSDASRAKAEASIRIGELQLQTNVAIASSQIKRYEVSLSKVIQEADLKARSLQAAGQMAATLAGGAMAAQHVQASISSQASDSTSFSNSFSQSGGESWQYAPTST